MYPVFACDGCREVIQRGTAGLVRSAVLALRSKHYCSDECRVYAEAAIGILPPVRA